MLWLKNLQAACKIQYIKTLKSKHIIYVYVVLMLLKNIQYNTLIGLSRLFWRFFKILKLYSIFCLLVEEMWYKLRDIIYYLVLLLPFLLD